MAMLKGSVAGREAGALKKTKSWRDKAELCTEDHSRLRFSNFYFYFLIDGSLFVFSVYISLQSRFLAYHM
jgi:hypothetical protein